MPRSLAKKATKKKAEAPVVQEPAIPAGKILTMKESISPRHHGLAVGFLILLFLVVGCLSAAFLMSQKMKETFSVASLTYAQLAVSEKQKADLREQLDNLRTLRDLSNRIAPAVVPSDVTWETYASSNLSIQYPRGYEVVKASSSFPALTIKSDKGRIEIFRMKDFPNGDRPFGFEDADVSQAELDQYIPKEFKSAAAADPKAKPYSVWIYYGDGDETTKALLDQAVSSIKVLK